MISLNLVEAALEHRHDSEDLEYVFTMADLWTANNKSLMGMTAHWIYPSTLKWEKAAIACRHVGETAAHV